MINQYLFEVTVTDHRTHNGEAEPTLIYLDDDAPADLILRCHHCGAVLICDDGKHETIA